MRFLPRTSRSDLPASWRGGWARVLTGIWMVLHLLLVAGAPVADAAMGHADQVVAHWEDSEGGDCPTSHGAEDCQICQVVVKSRALAASAASPAIAQTAEQQRSERARAVVPGFAFLEGHSSRAPPLG